ncbi:MAG TPA: hypothetical protein VMU62_04395 [Acidobacteriaceae bacterium]|nr:hypothetical protein [Acidobacteriaceae bacterium]
MQTSSSSDSSNTPVEISIWFFNGVMLFLYGLLIGGYGVYEIISGHTPPVVLARLHAPLWWGALLLVLGLGYCIKFMPGKGKTEELHEKGEKR